jgi:hypothetical protein
LAYAEWLKHNSNSYGDAVTDHFHPNNDAAISKLEDTVRELETRHEMLIAKLSNPTEQMMLGGALAHNKGLRPLRAAVTASEAKKDLYGDDRRIERIYSLAVSGLPRTCVSVHCD